MKVLKNKGEGQSQCFMCAAQGKWNIMWHSSSYSIISDYEHYSGKSRALCRDCLHKIVDAFDGTIELVMEETK